MKVLDKHFSEYIRIRDAVKGGSEIVKCFTCQNSDHYRYMQCGHFLSRKDLGVRFNEYNCHAQCEFCNLTLHGNMRVYEQRMIDVYGEGIVDHLRRLQKSTVKYTKWEYKVLIKDYKDRVKDLQKFIKTL